MQDQQNPVGSRLRSIADVKVNRFGRRDEMVPVAFLAVQQSCCISGFGRTQRVSQVQVCRITRELECA